MKAYAAEAGERQHFLLQLASAEQFPESKVLNSRHFACLVIWDSRGASPSELAAVLTALLRHGASYLMFWGPGCARLHAYADELICHPDSELGPPSDDGIMTTDHADESLDEALWFFMNLALPAGSLADTTRAGLAVTVANSDWAVQVDRALADRAALSERIFVDNPKDPGDEE